MKKTFLTAYILFTSLFSIAQISYESRIEFELKDGYSEERIIQFGGNGFIIRSKKDKNSETDVLWKYELFDTNLQAVKTKEVLIDKKYRVSATHHTDKYIHTLYINKIKYIIASLEIPSLEVTTVSGTLPIKAITSDMEVIDDYVFLKMFKNRHVFPLHSYPKNLEYLFTINWKEDNKVSALDILDDFNAAKTSIISMQADDNELIIHAEGRKLTGKEDYIVYFDNTGKKSEELINTDYDLVNISTNKLSDNQRIFTGTYGKGPYSHGVFFNVSDNKNINSPNTYKFTDLNNFFSYMPEKRREVIEMRKHKKEQKGKDFKKSYFMVAHDVMPLDDGYLLIAEACYPTYRTIPNTNYQNPSVHTSAGIRININRSSNTTYFTPKSATAFRTIFDGYQYTHATILKFDKAGNKQWDNTFRMRVAHKPYFPIKFIHSTEKNKNAIKLVFNTGQFIISKNIRYDGKTLQDYTSEEIKTIYDNDKEKWTSATVNHWYDNYFIAYGWQKIKNTANKEVKRKRKVIFINKIKYE